MTIETLSASDLAPQRKVPFYEYVRTVIRNLGVTFTRENPLFWSLTSGRHKQADMEGPYYLTGPPSRQIDDGKAVLASLEMLRRFTPMLLVVRVLGPDGKPVPNTVLDLWHADSDGNYYYASYTLRGKARTDAQGYVEILSVPPGPYGPQKVQRAGHYHVIIRTPCRSHTNGLVTQLYVCDGNDEKKLSTDFINYVRKARPGNMLHVWSTEGVKGENGTKDWPVLPEGEDELKTKVAWWNEKLSQVTSDVKVGACATKEIHLKASWF